MSIIYLCTKFYMTGVITHPYQIRKQWKFSRITLKSTNDCLNKSSTLSLHHRYRNLVMRTVSPWRVICVSNIIFINDTRRRKMPSIHTSLPTRKKLNCSAQYRHKHKNIMKKIQKQIILQILKKLKNTPEQAMKAQRWSRGIALLLL